jgi:hypothetical protein
MQPNSQAGGFMRRFTQHANTHWTILAAMAVALLGIGTFGMSSNLLGLDVGNSFALVMGVILWGTFFGLMALSGFFSASVLVPAAQAGLWLCFWPALTYWGHLNDVLINASEAHDDIETWWASSYVRWGVLLALLVVGYGRHWLWNQTALMDFMSVIKSRSCPWPWGR